MPQCSGPRLRIRRTQGNTEAVYEEPIEGWCPPEVLIPLAERLRKHTSTPGSIWFNGPMSAAPAVITGSSLIHTAPSLWWPDDRAWCVATEVDFSWTYVGGTAECMRSLESDARLEALRTDPEHRGDGWGDSVNDALFNGPES